MVQRHYTVPLIAYMKTITFKIYVCAVKWGEVALGQLVSQ